MTASFADIWTRLGRRAAERGVSRVALAQTLLQESLDAWDQVDAGKRRPRTTVIRRPRAKKGVTTLAPVEPLTETV